MNHHIYDFFFNKYTIMTQKDSGLVQQLLDSKLKNLNDKIDANNRNLSDKIDSNNAHVVELLSFIKEQTTKTNGRVTKTEDDIKKLNILDSQHIANCPRVKDIEKLENKIQVMDDNNLIVKIWNKYPKQLALLVIVGVIITLGTLGYTLYTIKTLSPLYQVENNEKVS